MHRSPGRRACHLIAILGLVSGCGSDKVDAVAGGGKTADGSAQGDAGQLTLDGLALPPARVGIPYSAGIVARGGIGSHAWSLVGDLPEGLMLSLSSGPSVMVIGTPLRSGLVRFELRVDDDRGQRAMAGVDLRVRGRRWVVYDTGSPVLDPAIQLVDLTQTEASPANHFAEASWAGLQPGGAKGAIALAGETGGLFAIDFGGLARSAPVRLGPAGARYVGWSPDGNQFAYVLGQEAFVVEPGGTPLRAGNLLPGEEFEWIRWVGSSLAYGARPADAIEGSPTRAEVVPTRPIGAPRLLETRRTYWQRPSPDGHRLAYAVSANPDAPQQTSSDLFVVGVDGHPPESPVKLNPADPDSVGVSDFAWAADGQKLVYASIARGTGARSLWVARFERGNWQGSQHLDGGQPSAQGDWRTIGFFEISPDSASVAYTAADKVLGGLIAELWHVHLAADQARPRNVSGPADAAAEPSAARDVKNVIWSADSRWLAFDRRVDLGGVAASRAFLVDMSGGEAGEPVRIDGTTVPGPVTLGSFSPDSTKFILRWGNGPAMPGPGAIKEDLFLVDVLQAGRATPMRINNPLPEGTDLEPRGFNIGKWSADGSEILFLTKDAASTAMFLADLSAARPTVRRISPPGKNAGLWYEGNFIEP